jgi:1,4-alpha-glucan branching enzyme
MLAGGDGRRLRSFIRARFGCDILWNCVKLGWFVILIFPGRNIAMKKAYSKTGRVCRVTFAVMPAGNVQTVAVCGEFNGWDPMAHPMKRQKDGRFALTLSLAAGQPYRFRYLLDGVRWENDPTADTCVPTHMGVRIRSSRCEAEAR